MSSYPREPSPVTSIPAGQTALLLLDDVYDDRGAIPPVVTVAPGRSLEQTARFFGDWLAGHEREHLEQMTRTIDRSRPRG